MESRTQGSRPRPRTQKKSESKAKDTKKIRVQGQGQPFRGQTLSRPRTGMLEAKAKDQGHKRKCSPKKKKVCTIIFQAISKKKKKVFTKIFQAISKKKKKVFTKIFQVISKKKKKGLHKNFSSDLHKITFSKKFFKRSTKF